MHGKGVYVHLEPAVDPWRQFLSLMWAISLREMKGRYRRSALGILWAVLPPVFYAGLFTALQGILHISTDDVPYVLFAYAGLVPWAFFVNAVNRCGGSVQANAGIVKKVAAASPSPASCSQASWRALASIRSSPGCGGLRCC